MRNHRLSHFAFSALSTIDQNNANWYNYKTRFSTEWKVPASNMNDDVAGIHWSVHYAIQDYKYVDLSWQSPLGVRVGMAKL